jgi:hypothetical protein
MTYHGAAIILQLAYKTMLMVLEGSESPVGLTAMMRYSISTPCG